MSNTHKIHSAAGADVAHPSFPAGDSGLAAKAHGPHGLAAGLVGWERLRAKRERPWEGSTCPKISRNPKPGWGLSIMKA